MEETIRVSPPFVKPLKADNISSCDQWCRSGKCTFLRKLNSLSSWCHVNSVIDNPQIFSLNKTSFDSTTEHHGLVFRHLKKEL